MIAYFVMECAIDNNMPTYSGGLGVLAGDTLQSFADLDVPVSCVTMLWKNGFISQKISEDGVQFDGIQDWDPDKYLKPTDIKTKIPLGDDDVFITAWKYIVKGINGYEIPVYFLTTDLEENNAEDRKICDRLYIGNNIMRLKQEIVLGIGGYEILKAMNYDPYIYHINESHSAFLITSLMKNLGDINKLRAQVVFTTHTPISEAFDSYNMQDVVSMLNRYINTDIIDSIYGKEENKLNLSWLAIENAKNVVAVSRKHKYVSQKIFEGYKLKYVTNGIHHFKWASAHHKMLYSKYIKGWEEEPYLLSRVVSIHDNEFIKAHELAKSDLIEMVNSETGVSFTPESFTIGMAKRVTQYKRNNLILHNPDKLIEIAEKTGDIQMVFAGKTHPLDNIGKSIIQSIYDASRYIMSKTKKIRIVFIENFDMQKEILILAGSDLWLNTPTRPLEASGTSGIKASLNGVPSFSVYDGWWLEACNNGVNGWGIGPRPSWEDLTHSSDEEDLADIYDKLKYIILPMFYDSYTDYVKIMKTAVSTIIPYFNSHRMVSEYITDLYLTAMIQRYQENCRIGIYNI